MGKTVIVKRSLPTQGEGLIRNANNPGQFDSNTKGRPDIIIAGASVRAAAFSALRAGFLPWCVDLFGDLDLEHCCPFFQRIHDYPKGFLRAIQGAPNIPWMYTGGLENYPELVANMAKQRHLFGNNANELRMSRLPECLSNLAKKVGLDPPAWINQPSSGTWLVKPLRSSGGQGIYRWKNGEPIDPQKEILQEYLEGISVSAVFCGCSRGSVLLGATRQLVGEHFLNARDFYYCGSVGPIQFEELQARRLESLGNLLADEIGLRGLFGIDGILSNGLFRPLEINPRYTASIEILEMAMDKSALEMHWKAFHGDSQLSRWGKLSRGCFAKGILFAPADIVIPGSAKWLNDKGPGDPWNTFPPQWADLPRAGESIKAGRPILTLYSSGIDDYSCLNKLKKQAASMEADLYPYGIERKKHAEPE